MSVVHAFCGLFGAGDAFNKLFFRLRWPTLSEQERVAVVADNVRLVGRSLNLVVLAQRQGVRWFRRAGAVTLSSVLRPVVVRRSTADLVPTAACRSVRRRSRSTQAQEGRCQNGEGVALIFFISFSLGMDGGCSDGL